MKTKILICQMCEGKFTTTRRADTKYCEDCRTKTKWRVWGKTEGGRARKAELHRKLREAAFAGYGGECSCCGEDTFEFLALDHVNGGGREERKRLSTYQIARKVVNENWPETYQVLCHNCNCAKGWFGVCPHQRKRTA